MKLPFSASIEMPVGPKILHKLSVIWLITQRMRTSFGTHLIFLFPKDTDGKTHLRVLVECNILCEEDTAQTLNQIETVLKGQTIYLL